MFKNLLLSEGDQKHVVFSLIYGGFFSAKLAKEYLRETEAFDILYLIKKKPCNFSVKGFPLAPHFSPVLTISRLFLPTQNRSQMK